MKAVILAGGNGTRLLPLTKVTNKHLLPVFDKPMIFYPIETVKKMGIKDILIVTGKEYAGDFMKLLNSGKEFGVNFTFRVQNEAEGIANALLLGEDFAGGENIVVVLGDNIFEDNFEKDGKNFDLGAKIFLKKIKNPQRFGVAEVSENRVMKIVEKPKNPKSDFAVTGIYFYDNTVFEKLKKCKKSDRGEYEITDLNNFYIEENNMQFGIINGQWTDAGTHESLFLANKIARNL